MQFISAVEQSQKKNSKAIKCFGKDVQDPTVHHMAHDLICTSILRLTLKSNNLFYI